MRSRIFMVVLCLALVTSGASAMGMPWPTDREPGGGSVTGVVLAFLNDLGCKIDPWGRCGAGQGESTSPSDGGSEVGPEIDPWGDENTAQPDGPAGDLGLQIDPWG